MPDANIIYLADKPDRNPSRIRGRSTREGVEKAFATLAARATVDDEVVVVLFGHGSFDGRQASFNLPGPDLSAADYAALLGRLSSRRVAFVNTTSSSGAFLQPLAAPGRVIVTATRTGGESNETRFPAYFVEAFGAQAADTNRDGQVSLLEAFDYARAKTAKAYEQDGLLLTEHAALEDGGDGHLAATLSLTSARAQAAKANVSDPALKAIRRSLGRMMPAGSETARCRSSTTAPRIRKGPSPASLS